MSEQRMIYAEDLQEEIKSLRMCITGMRAGKGLLNKFMKEYRKSVLQIIDDQPTVNPETLPIVRKLREKLARYEQAEKEGRLVELPCRVGDTVYVIVQSRYQNMYVKIKSRVWEFSVGEHGQILMVYMRGLERQAMDIESFGKWWFCSSAAADAARKELGRAGR